MPRVSAARAAFRSGIMGRRDETYIGQETERYS